MAAETYQRIAKDANAKQRAVEEFKEREIKQREEYLATKRVNDPIT